MNSKIPQIAFDWYDEYAHGDIDRRTFVSRLATLAVAGLTANTITAALLPNYAQAEQISFNDPDITASYQNFDSPKGHGTGRGYLVLPSKLEQPAPTVLVIHENRGLNPYIKDVARRLAKKGFIALAPDALFPLGGYPGNDDEGRSMQSSMDKMKIEQDFIASAQFLKQYERGNGKVGAVGFCFGGYICNMIAATIPDTVNAISPFYGTPANDNIVNQVKGPLLLHFAELDKRVNATWPSYEEILKKNKVPYEAYMYSGVNHGFHNDSTARYDEQSAELAWSRTIDFFNHHLTAQNKSV
ncbi:dienelactone hydrolase family protein [Gynuella sunshinyii]|uniref:Dienelactone hydrolase-related enzyme n=1 Tax=Gynuella sunshinyii YC6258 TaxID=1445510 RepID=A0A0C5VKW4_9GAMM|nr:dienelactone hydrolase family protein [Gynuella sunshinyii]AJQ95312.1 dienelactone hydrolase-related enzyme [Gynuella sunshinyii YC6258]